MIVSNIVKIRFKRNFREQSLWVFIGVVDRLPHLGSKGAYLKQMMQDKLIKHKHYIKKNGQDLPEIRNWKWDLTHE